MLNFVAQGTVTKVTKFGTPPPPKLTHYTVYHKGLGCKGSGLKIVNGSCEQQGETGTRLWWHFQVGKPPRETTREAMGYRQGKLPMG